MGSKMYKNDLGAVACGGQIEEDGDGVVCYISDEVPGITRRKCGRGFSYLDGQGKRVADRGELERIKSLVIPPAWTDVWISPLAQGHIQATGRDAKGRKQYIYHPQWTAARQQNKFARLIDFGRALTRIRRQVDRDLRRPKMDLEKVCAIAVALLDSTKIRIGNREYRRQNRSYGLTTLENRHVEVSGATIQIDFTGKSGKHHKIDIYDRRLARQVLRCQELPGQELFQYLDEEGSRRPLNSEDVNAYLQRSAGKTFSAKDLRTWWGTVLMAEALNAATGDGNTGGAAKRRITAAVRKVAAALGNTITVCRQYYIHPGVMDAFENGRLAAFFKSTRHTEPRSVAIGLSPAESAVLRILKDERAKS